MSTPSIQTLIAQAQQVLNLKSSNEIRATLAAILANANVGTPLNPNLTTQQLWDEFYEIVRQPSDDIMSIITDQMMRMVFSPPAPGGAGADKQVIFNDGGVLAGDAGLMYNKATDALTITGDLTAARLIVTGGTIPTNGLWLATTNTLEFAANSLAQYRIAPLGVFSWFDGAGGTRMTLNSTGLGVGVAPSAGKFEVLETGTGSGLGGIFASTATAGGNPGFVFRTASTNRWSISLTGTAGAESIRFYDVNAAATRLTVDSAGNLGIGVTPSAIANVIRLEIGGALSANLTLRSSSGNASARNWMVGANMISFGDFVIRQGNSQGAEPNSGTDRLVLDASGNLGIGIVTPTYKLDTQVAGGADRSILRAAVTGVSGGFNVNWNHATLKTRVIIENIPTSAAGLATGTLWNDAGTIKIA